MSKRLEQIREGAFKAMATDQAETDRLTAHDAQKEKAQKDRFVNKKASSALPKNNASVFSVKPEPNRGPGTSRHPNVPHAHRTGPTNEAIYTDKKSWEEDMREHGATEFEKTDTRVIAKKADGDVLGAWSVSDKHGITGLGTNLQAEARESEYSANRSLSSSKPAAPGHYLVRSGSTISKAHPTAQHALQAYHALPNKEGVKIHQVKEGFGDMLGDKKGSERRKRIAKNLRDIRASNKARPKKTDVFVPPKGSLPWKEEFAVAMSGGSSLQKIKNKNKGKAKTIKEDGGAVMGVGGGDPAHVTNPTDNYAAQKKRLGGVKTKMARRKKPIGEAYTPGVAYDKTIYLMRHGKTALDSMKRSDGWLDFPLTDDGRLGLIKAQQFLKNVPMSVVYAADLKRTKETGEIIASGILSSPPVEIANELKTWNLGNMMGTVKKPNKPIVKHYMENPDEKPVGGESMNEFRGRFLPWIENIKEEVSEGCGPVLIVVSGSNLREISFNLYKDHEVLNLDEGGLLCLQPSGNGWHAQVIFGHKDGEEDYVS